MFNLVQSAFVKDKRSLDTEMARLDLKVSQLTDENTSLQQVCTQHGSIKAFSQAVPHVLGKSRSFGGM